MANRGYLGASLGQRRHAASSDRHGDLHQSGWRDARTQSRDAHLPAARGAAVIAATLRASKLRIGQATPPLEREISMVRMIAYAGATWDWHRLHYDQIYATARNLPGPIADGQMFGALLAEMLLDWLGPRAFIRRLSFRLRDMVFPDDTIRCEGEVASIDVQRDCDLVTITMRIRVGERVVVELASAQIALPN
jgi:acyl dehydratase